MSPRPRTVSDADILMAAGTTITRVGPGKLTLAAVGKEIGLSAATLVQRFGSKRGLLLAMATSAAESVDACFEKVRAAHPSPLAALIAAATAMTDVDTPEEMANHLAFLQMDLSDPDFHRRVVVNSTRTLDGYRRLLRDAVDAGELRACDTRRLARVISAMWIGALISWAVFRKGTADAWVRADIEAILEPYRPRRRRRRRRAKA
jgi:AcrR family transcriptional regulator